MQVIESFIRGKENNPATCEDGLFLSRYLVAVIDGVTAKGSHLWDGRRSGCFAKDRLLGCLQDVVEGKAADFFSGEEFAVWLLERLDKELRAVTLCNYGTDLPPEEMPRASIIMYNDVRKEVISYGDCQCRINDTVYSHVKKIDELNADLRAFYLEYYRLQGMTLEELQENDLGRAAIQGNLLMQFSFENKNCSFGYPVLNGMGIEPALMHVYKVEVGDELILASDGYPKLKASLEESERCLEQILQEDAMCFQRFRSTKGVKSGNVSFDDRTFCRMKVL